MGAKARIGLAHRRLAILDLTENGAQPMSTPDGQLHIVFNGEIYNYRDAQGQRGLRGWSLSVNEIEKNNIMRKI